MATFDVVRRSALPATEAWNRLTDWERHGEFIPLTQVSMSGPARRAGARFIARTSVGRLGFDDPMEVTLWEPPTKTRPGVCRIVKKGRVVRGGAHLTVSALPDGSVVHWREEATLRFGGRALDHLNRQLGRAVFGRLIDALLR